MYETRSISLQIPPRVGQSPETKGGRGQRPCGSGRRRSFRQGAGPTCFTTVTVPGAMATTEATAAASWVSVPSSMICCRMLTAAGSSRSPEQEAANRRQLSPRAVRVTERRSSHPRGHGRVVPSPRVHAFSVSAHCDHRNKVCGTSQLTTHSL